MKNALEISVRVLALVGIGVWAYEILSLMDAAKKYLKFKTQPLTIIIKNESK